MSLVTWKAQFYPVEAKNVAKEAAIEHSLAKWRGLMPDNLAAHRVMFIAGRTPKIVDAVDPLQQLLIYSDTCALCHYHLWKEEPWTGA